MRSTLLDSTLAATHRRGFSGWATAHGRKAIVRGLIVASLALAAGCAYDGPPGYYYGDYGGGGVYLDGVFADGRYGRGFHDVGHDGHFEGGHEGGYEGHEGGHDGGHDGGHEGGGHGGGGGGHR